MGKVEASADVNVQPDSTAQVIRKRLAEGDIEVDNIPFIDTEPGDSFKVKCNSPKEFAEFIEGWQNEDEDTIKKYLERE